MCACRCVCGVCVCVSILHTLYPLNACHLSTPLSPEEAASFAEQMLGSKLITIQTGNKGKPCNKVSGRNLLAAFSQVMGVQSLPHLILSTKVCRRRVQGV